MKNKAIIKYVLISFLSLVFIGLIVGIIGGTAIFYQYAKDLPDIRELKNYRPSLTTKVFSDSNELLDEFYIERRILVPLTKIPKILINASISVEDSRFFQHHGIDILGISRAFIKNVKAGRIVEGGSTITQQVAKTMFLSPERKIKRKIKELILALRIERFFSKNEILEIYFNQIYYGHGAYGVEAAAKTYFDKHVQQITLAEAAFIAGLPRAPVHYSPFKNLEKAWKRRAYALNRMVREGYISPREAERAANSEFKLASRFKKNESDSRYFVEYIRQYIQKKYGSQNLYRDGLNIYTTLNLRDQKFARKAVLKGLRKADKRYGYRGPIGKIELYDDETNNLNLMEISQLNLQSTDNLGENIFVPDNIVKGVVTNVNKKSVDVNLGGTTGVIDLKDMSWARKPDTKVDGRYAKIKRADKVLSVGDIIEVRILPDDKASQDDNEKNNNELDNNKLKLALEQEPLVQGALVSIDIPTGHIKSMVGGLDFSESEFNRAVQASRQPGSAFKPVIYSAALENGFTPSSIIVDSPVIYSDDNKRVESMWKPINFEKKFYGPTTLRNAITHSRNIVTIKILQTIGVKTAVDFMRRIGVESKINKDLSLALGSSNVTLMELTSIYSTFARGGMKINPIAVRYITDRNGNILEENDSSPERVLSEEIAYVITNLLKNVVKEGTGRKVKALGRPTAGKTGTTNNYVDAWFLGYTSQRATGVWVGMDDDTPLGKYETGSRTASPIWLDYMISALEGTPITDFKAPSSIVFTRVDSKSGLLASAGEKKFIFESFIDGTVPLKYSADKRESREDFLSKDLVMKVE